LVIFWAVLHGFYFALIVRGLCIRAGLGAQILFDVRAHQKPKTSVFKVSPPDAKPTLVAAQISFSYS